jgi:hypothetical protein
MSLPLQDIGNIKVEQSTHSWLKAVSQVRGLEVTSIVRQILDSHASQQLQEAILAQEIHQRKGLEEISSKPKR